MLRGKPLQDELLNYLKRNIKKGYTKESLKWALIEQGYSRLEVEKALKNVDVELAREAPVLKTKPSIEYEVVEPKSMASKAHGLSIWQKIKKILSN